MTRNLQMRSLALAVGAALAATGAAVQASAFQLAEQSASGLGLAFAGMAPAGQDASTVFWNPFRRVWVDSIRHVYKVGDAVDKRYGFARRRSYHEGADVLAAARWDVNEPFRWTDVDRLDPQRDDLKIKPQL